MKLLLIFLGLIPTIFTQSAEHKKTFRNSKNFKELSRNINIMASHRHKAGQQVKVQHTDDRVSMAGMSMKHRNTQVGLTSAEMVHDTEPDHNVNLHHLESLQQGNDTCEVREICVPVPFLPQDNAVIIWPTCIQIPRCIGSCCESSEGCKSSYTVLQNYTVALMRYIGGDDFKYDGDQVVAMEKHLACNCHNCDNKQCHNVNKIVDEQCNCVCDEAKRMSCMGTWYEADCSCKCDDTALCSDETPVAPRNQIRGRESMKKDRSERYQWDSIVEIRRGD
ncbi:unnamed protein product, partial [Mesorhabditis spiculigera]